MMFRLVGRFSIGTTVLAFSAAVPTSLNADAPPVMPATPWELAPWDQQKWSDSDIEALTLLIRSSLTAPSSLESRERVLDVLRSLKDPSLKPLWAAFAASGVPQLRFHGIFGLSDLDPNARIDLLAVRSIDDPAGRAHILGHAVRERLIDREQLGDIARWTDLDPTLRVLVLWQHAVAGAPPAVDTVRSFLSAEPFAARVFAALLLTQLGHADPQTETILSEAQTLTGEERDAAVSVVLGFLRGVADENIAPFVRQVADSSSTPPLMRFEALRTLLAIAPGASDTSRRFSEASASESETGGRVRLALALFEAAVDVRAAGKESRSALREAADALSNDRDQDVAELGGAARSVLIPDGASAHPMEEALTSPTILQRRSSARLSLRACERLLGPEQAEQTRIRVLESTLALGRNDAEHLETAVAAAAALADHRPDSLRPLLDAFMSESDERSLSTVLIGVARSPHAGCLALADGVLAGSKRSESAASPLSFDLATVIRARHLALLPERPEKPHDFGELVRCALGPTDLPMPLRVEAAWLALAAAKQERVALIRIMAGPSDD